MEGRCRRLEGKVAVVTASTQGIGLAIAERLGLEGAAVIVSSRKQKNMDEAVCGLKAKGIAAAGVVCHVSDAWQRKNLVDTAVKNFGHIDIIVSNAAANPTVGGILEMKEAVLDKMWDVNVKASILLLQEAAPHLRKGSSVIIISSIGGYDPKGGVAMYSVTKTALFGLTKVYNALAGEMGPNTRVNCVAPGFVPTRFASFLTTNETIATTLSVCDPVTGAHQLLPELPDGGGKSYSYSAAVLCAAAGGCDHHGCHHDDHHGCHHGGNTDAMARAWVHSAESAAWSAAASVEIGEHSFVETRKRGAIVGGDQLFFLLNMGTAILKFDLGTHSLSVIGSPLVYGEAVVLMSTEDRHFLQTQPPSSSYWFRRGRRCSLVVG
nr:unnamed protein product [Digitaria exilis]